MGFWPQIAVIGAHDCTAPGFTAAEDLGRLIATRGGVVICGGRGGVMEAAAKGARSAGGLVVALLPGEDHAQANAYVDVVLPTGLGIARNALIVRAAHGVVAVEGGLGTLSEIAMALKLGRPVVGLGTWPGIEGLIPAADPADALARLWPRLVPPVEKGPGKGT